MAIFGVSITQKFDYKAITENWNSVIPNAEGRGEKILDEVLEKIRAAELPDVEVKKVEVAMNNIGKLKSTFFVHVKHKERHQMFIGARDFGKNLLVSWYFLGERWTRNIKKDDRQNIFEDEELAAYVAIGRSATIEATEILMRELNQDFSKIDTKSGGILNIS